MSYSGRGRIRLLLDSTYLLPILGVDVVNAERALAVLEKLYKEGRLKPYYSPFSLLEILGKISKMSFDADRVRLGLKAITVNMEELLPTVDAYMKALELRRRGFKDLIDLFIYATSRSTGVPVLTRDYELLEFLRSIGEDTGNVLLEEDFVKMYG